MSNKSTKDKGILSLIMKRGGCKQNNGGGI